jgi:hypothetical protein
MHSRLMDYLCSRVVTTLRRSKLQRTIFIHNFWLSKPTSKEREAKEVLRV